MKHKIQGEILTVIIAFILLIALALSLYGLAGAIKKLENKPIEQKGDTIRVSVVYDKVNNKILLYNETDSTRSN